MTLADQAVAGCHLDLTPTLPPFTVQQTAPLLSVSEDTVYDGVRRGEIRALRLGRAIRIPRREVARLLGLEDGDGAGFHAAPHAPTDDPAPAKTTEST